MVLTAKWFVLYFFVSAVATFEHTINLFHNSSRTECVMLNGHSYQCDSFDHVLQLLSKCCNSTDVIVEPGTYHLTSSHNITNLQNIRMRSKTSQPATIQCTLNTNGSYDIDTGIAFIRVRNLVIEHLNFIGCGMKHVSNNYIGEGQFIMVRSALYIQNSTDVSLYGSSISYNNGIGLLMYDTNGTVNITKTSFINNTLNMVEHSRSFTGGGGVYIHFTNCTPGIINCNALDNLYNKDSDYTINHCTFQNNSAFYSFNGSKADDRSIGISITFGTGGGLSYLAYGEAQNNSLRILSSLFSSNLAFFGGGINIRSKYNSMSTHAEIFNCNFTYNFIYRVLGDEGGGGGISAGYVIYQIGGETVNNTYNISGCLFEGNKAPYGIGGGVIGFGSREPRRIVPTIHFEIYSSSFISNEALYGSAIQMSREYFDSITVGTYFTVVIDNCIFDGNYLRDLPPSDASNANIAAVALSGIGVRFVGQNKFIGNTATALLVEGATAEFSNNSFTVFENNSGLHGGAILLINGAWISVFPNSTLVFLQNSALDYGGAIYVDLSTPFDYLLSRICFIRYFSENFSPSKWDTNFTFINNTAGQSNSGNTNTIFASTLQPCIRVFALKGTEVFVDKPFDYIPPATVNTIATSPERFNYAQNSFKIVPGEVYNLPVQLLDELNQNVSAAIFIATCNGSPTPYVVAPYHFTNGSIKIAGSPGETCQLQLQTVTDYSVATTLQIVLLQCPPGFLYNDDIKQCECLVNPSKQKLAIGGCDFESFRAYFDQFYWIGYESDKAIASNLLTTSCPYRYCYKDHINDNQLPRVANKTTLDKFVCGDRNRTGFLCGKCVEGHSVTLNSPQYTCNQCENYYMGTLYLFLSYLVPVSILFYIIMTYNIRMTTGTFGAILFFSQIISSQYRFGSDYALKGNSSETLTATDIVITIYSVSNLELFHHDVFSFCLFPNAGTVDVLAFNLLLSFYPVVLVFLYFLLRRYCICNYPYLYKFRLSNKSVTHGICAFLVLSFARINVLAFGILESAKLSYVNNKTTYKTVVYLQGDIEYFGDARYNLYAIGAFVALATIVFIPTLILVLHPIMIVVCCYFQWGESMVVRFVNKVLFINKLKPVLDSFQGDYKNNLAFFAGLHSFLYRIIFFSILVSISTPDVNRLLFLMLTFFLLILLIHVLVMPFKRYVDNAAYSLVYILMLATLMIKQYVFFASSSEEGLIWLEISIALLPLLCVLAYCSWRLWMAVPCMRRKNLNGDQQPNLVRMYLQNVYIVFVFLVYDQT